MTEMSRELSEIESTVKGMKRYWTGDAGDVHQEMFADIIPMMEEYGNAFPETVTGTDEKSVVFDTDLLD